jgi:hypothetical protein
MPARSADRHAMSRSNRSRRTPTAFGAALIAAVLVGALCTSTPAATSRSSAANLLQNGDAEAGTGATGNGIAPPPGWSTTGAFTAGRYGTSGLPNAPAGGGSNVFAGGPGQALSTATQTVSVSSSSAAIDAEQVKATLSALLGGWEGQEDAATVQATFLDASGGARGSLTVGPVTATDRGGATTLLLRSAAKPVPSSTRSVRVVITARRSSGIYNDGYSDNVSLTLSAAGAKPTPAPAPAWPPLPNALVAIDSVSNGCGSGKASAQGKFGDTSLYRDSNVNPLAKSYTVNFREACKLHDAGYSGAKVRDALHAGKVVDFFTWTKKEVDDKFYEDMVLICERSIPASAAVALANCKATGGNGSFGAKSRYNFVNRFGGLFWNDRPNLRGQWTLKGDAVAAPWAVTQSRRTVKIVWHGGAGHANLRGEFRGTLISRDQDSIVKGFAHLTENGGTTTGKMSFRFDAGTVLADELVFRGAGVSGTLER